MERIQTLVVVIISLLLVGCTNTSSKRNSPVESQNNETTQDTISMDSSSSEKWMEIYDEPSSRKYDTTESDIAQYNVRCLGNPFAVYPEYDNSYDVHYNVFIVKTKSYMYIVELNVALSCSHEYYNSSRIIDDTLRISKSTVFGTDDCVCLFEHIFKIPRLVSTDLILYEGIPLDSLKSSLSIDQLNPKALKQMNSPLKLLIN